LIAPVAALVHAPAARLAMLRKMLRGNSFMSGLLSAVNGCQDEAFRCKFDAVRNDEGRTVIAQAYALTLHQRSDVLDHDAMDFVRHVL
jgi:hypothetical protein